MASLAELLAGDPEAQGAANTSAAMAPAVNAHFSALAQQMADWAQQQQAMNQRLQGQPLSQQALDPEGLQSAMSMALSTGPGAIKAYHGSPYDFDAFDASKIGSGEGAQAYGHGIYVAESPSVAETYRTAGPAGKVPSPTYEAPSDILARNAENFGKFAVSDPLLVKGLGALDVEGRSNVLPMMRGLLQDSEVGKAVVRLLPVDVMHMLGGKQFSPQALLDNPSMLVDLLPAHANDLVPSRVQAADILAPYVARATAERPLVGAQSRSLLQEALAARSADNGDLHVRSEVPYPTAPGKMYEVNINADPEQFLNWDKPLSEQPTVQRKLAGAGVINPRSEFPEVLARANTATGGQVYESSKLVPGAYRDPRGASDALNQMGIPGIRYLDQGSRASGNGTNNYVVFDPKIIDIVKKYGLAGLLATGAATMGGGDQK